MRTPRPTVLLAAVAVVCAGLAVASAASAGTPSSVTVGVAGAAPASATYAGGAVIGNADPLGPPAPACTSGQCDREAVTVKAPAGYTDAHTIALTAKITFDDSAGDTVDVGILDGKGNVVASSVAVGSGATTTAAKVSPGSYTIEVDGDIAVTTTSFSMAVGTIGADKVVQPTAKTGALTFSRETVSDPFRLGTEPNITVAGDDKTLYESPIFGFSTTQSFLSRSSDEGQTFKNLSFLPGIGKLDQCSGGGDSDIATDQFTGDIYMIDLGGAPTVPARVSSDKGQTFTSSCLANQAAGPNVFTDRQWLSTDLVHHREWYIYRDGLINPGSTGTVTGTDVDAGKQAYGEYIKYAPLPTAAGTAGQAQLDFQPVCTTTGGIATPCVNDVQIAGNAITDNGIGTSPYAGTTYVAEETTKGVGVMIVKTAGSTSTVTESIVPGNHHQVLFPTIAVDRAGTVYETYTDATTYQVEMTKTDDGGKTWSKPVVVNGAPAATTVMPWVVAGDKGRIDVVYYATANPLAPSDNYGPWYAYLAQSLDADSAAPTFTQNAMTDRPNHIDPVCLSGLGCTTNTGPGGDRELGDFFKVTIDSTGRALVSFADGDNQLGNEVANGPLPAPSFGHFVRQATGPSLYVRTGQVAPIPVPSNSVTAAEHTAPLPLQTPVTGAVGDNAPSEVLRSSATSVGDDAAVHIRLTADDLSAALPAASGATTATYLTRWIYKNKVYFASAENSGGQWSFFGGQAVPVTDGAAIKYAAYPSTTAVTGTVTGNTIDLTVPGSVVGSPSRTATLYSVTTWALAETAPTPPAIGTTTALPSFPQVGDVLPAYNTVSGGATLPGVPQTGTSPAGGAQGGGAGAGTAAGPVAVGGNLAFTGLAAWHTWLALVLLGLAAALGGTAVRLRRR